MKRLILVLMIAGIAGMIGSGYAGAAPFTK